MPVEYLCMHVEYLPMPVESVEYLPMSIESVEYLPMPVESVEYLCLSNLLNTYACEVC